MPSPPTMTRVLIVDDEPESRTRLRTLLQAHGHAVSEATNGLDALEQARQQPPNLVGTWGCPRWTGFALLPLPEADGPSPWSSTAPLRWATQIPRERQGAGGPPATARPRPLPGQVDGWRGRHPCHHRDAPRARCADSEGGVEPDPDGTESWRFYDESLINTLEHRNLELADEVRVLRSLTSGLEQLPAIVSLTDTRGRITFVNRRFEEATGFSRDMVRGQTHAILRTQERRGGRRLRDSCRTAGRQGMARRVRAAPERRHGLLGAGRDSPGLRRGRER